MIPVETLKRHTLYLAYYNNKNNLFPVHQIIYFKFMGKENQDTIRVKIYGFEELISNHKGNIIFNEGYDEHVSFITLEDYEVFEISFEEFSTHVVVNII